MTRSKRVLSAFLAFMITVTLLPAPVAHAAGTSTYNGTTYSTDYTTWRQADPAWGGTALGDLHTLGGSGCLISAIAILMCHSGAYDPASLNPGSLRDWLDSKNCISHSADRSKDALLSFGLITSTLSPRFYFVNQEFFDTSTPMSDISLRISELTASGYYVVARVKNSGHFVAVASAVSGDARIYDSGYVSKKLLSEYNGTIGGLIYFKANKSGKDTILPSVGVPTAPVITGMSDTYGTGDNISLSWASTSLTTHYNIYVEQKQTDGKWKENFRYYFYVTSPFTFDALPAGQYRLKLQSTNANANPWTFANSAYKEFTVKPGVLTITYNANGGSCSTASQLVKQYTKYDLPTPTRSDAAFLGWYTEDGKLVTTSSTVTTDKGHTLTAKWDTGGVGFKKSASYANTFRDVAKSAWYYSSVALVYSYGLMNGTESNKFSPSDQITGAQSITLAARLRKIYLTGDGTFSKSSPWYKTYSDYAINQKIVSAEPSDMNAVFTRQEFAAMIANALPSAALPAINDIKAGSIPDVYRSDASIYKLYRAGIFAGTDAAGTFRPNDPISRAEVAAVLVRLADPNVRMLFTLK
ncbi:MAG: S-layer homology domain-containing protein [Ruminiclostridium sp.]|nr:S-layer homology domain-containing protein [Ruminiclostridium sp.]